MSSKNLHVVGKATPPSPPEPPRPLGTHGLALWRQVTTAYDISDAGGREMLCEACTMLDRAEGLAAAITRDGPIIYSKAGPKDHPGIRHELAARAFVVRTLARLGLDVEAIRPVGRPPGFA